ncbi:hypothetical protein ACE1BJ_25020, partial [Aeromonas jandaei]
RPLFLALRFTIYRVFENSLPCLPKALKALLYKGLREVDNTFLFSTHCLPCLPFLIVVYLFLVSPVGLIEKWQGGRV